MSLMRPFLQQPMMQQGLSQGLANFGTYQQMMLDMLRQAGNASSASSDDDEKEAATSAKKTTQSSAGSKAKSTASSRSRADSKRSGT